MAASTTAATQPSVPTDRSTFAEAYCLRHGHSAGDFERTLLQETLHPLARWSRFVLRLIPHYFEPDLRFIRDVGRIRRLRDLRGEEIDFKQDRANRGLLRGKLRLRVSSRRLRKIVERTLADQSAPSPHVAPRSASAPSLRTAPLRHSS